MSLCVASEPELRPAPVSVRVAAPQMSEAIATPLVSVRVPLVQTAAGSDATEATRLVRYEPIELEAVVTIVLVFVLMFEASEVEAVSNAESVWVLTPEVTAAVWVFVLLLTLFATEEEAAIIAEANEEDAVFTSLWVASEPDESDPPVSVRVAEFQISPAMATPSLKVRPVLAQTAAGSEATEATRLVR